MTSTLHARPISRGSFEGSHMPTKRIGLLDSSDIRVPPSRYEGDMYLPLSSSLLQEHQLVNNKRIYSWSVGCSQRHHLTYHHVLSRSRSGLFLLVCIHEKIHWYLECNSCHCRASCIREEDPHIFFRRNSRVGCIVTKLLMMSQTICLLEMMIAIQPI